MRYQTESAVTVEILPSQQLGELELVALAEEVRQSKQYQGWNVRVGGSISVIPLVHEGAVYFGSCDKNFYALDAETGREKWRFTTNDVILGGKPGLGEGVLYFGSFDHHLYAVDLEGREQWRFDAGEKLCLLGNGHAGRYHAPRYPRARVFQHRYKHSLASAEGNNFTL